MYLGPDRNHSGSLATIRPVSSSRRLPALLVVLAVAASITACGNDTTTHQATKSACTYAKDDTARVSKKVSPPPGDPPKDLPAALTIATNHGDIKVSLDTAQAPCSVNAFVSLAKQGYFDNTHCHRLVDQGLYLLQCGDAGATGKPDSVDDGSGGPGFDIRDELVDKDARLQPCTGQVDPQSGREVCTYTTGTVALANSGPDTSGSQFFLVYRDSSLPNAYTVIGKMSAAGVKVVQTVAQGGAYPPNATSGNTPPKLETIITSVK